MFTGIIEETGTVKKINDREGGRILEISCSFTNELRVDQSICINGVCHTVTKQDSDRFTVQSVEETLRKTNIGDLETGSLVNLERSLRPDQLVDGHIVQGHADTTGTIKKITKEGTDRLFTIAYPEEFRDLIVGRGSVAVDGISLTISTEKDTKFTVAIIPYTLEHTNFSEKEEGDSVNLEFDILGKYVIRYLQNRDQ